jgi:type IV secretory pathway TrbD component
MTVKRAASRQLESAEASAAAARADVLATLQEIRRRIDPRVIVAETAERGVARVNGILDGAQETVRTRPWLVALGATLFGIAVAARARLLAESDATDETLPETDG